jgi:hypothetical protein
MTNPHTALSFFPVTPQQVLQLYWLPVRTTLKLQYALINGITLGLLDDLHEEIEHALVNGADVVDVLATKIQLMQQSPLTGAQRQLLVQTSLEDAEGQLKHILSDLLTTVLKLPFNRLAPQPDRRRFPVTIEGQSVREPDAGNQ